MTRLVECGIWGIVIAGAWIALAWAAGAQPELSAAGWCGVALLLIVTYGSAVELAARVAAGSQRGDRIAGRGNQDRRGDHRS